MRLFYYTHEIHAISNIRAKSIKLSFLKDVNDPFEFHGTSYTNFPKKLVDNVKNQLDQTKGMVCFSETYSNPLMWGHYADNHKGICLAFELNYQSLSKDIKLNKINYQKRRPNYTEIKDSKSLVQTMSSKSMDWSYEKEHRLLLPLKSAIKLDSGIYLHPFDKILELKQVILGLRSNCTPESIINNLAEYDTKISIIGTSMSKKKYKIIKNPRKCFSVFTPQNNGSKDKYGKKNSQNRKYDKQ